MELYKYNAKIYPKQKSYPVGLPWEPTADQRSCGYRNLYSYPVPSAQEAGIHVHTHTCSTTLNRPIRRTKALKCNLAPVILSHWERHVHVLDE